MENKKVSIEFTQDEIEELLDEMIRQQELEKKLYPLRAKYEQDPELAEIYYKVHKNNLAFYQSMIDKLADYSEDLIFVDKDKKIGG